jgi:23S rRNA (guanosine2251-2'-O)-methyltransferase
MDTTMKQTNTYIYGKHAVSEAIENKPEIIKVIFRAYRTEDKALDALIKKSGIKVKEMTGNNQAGDDVAHQGVLAEIDPQKMLLPYKEFIDGLTVTTDTVIVLLDELQDPHNVGAIIRSAAGFGIAGVLIPEHDQVQVTGAVVKVSAGMAFRIPLVSVGNVNTTVRDLKEKGFWIYGLSGEGKNSLNKEKFDSPTCFILGNEGKGIRQKTEELCDIHLSIPMHPQCESLNVAAAGAVVFHEWSKQHPNALNTK